MKLVIIEGIGKKATIEKYLGADYKVFATGGHVRDLPKATLAVNVKNNFEPRYDILPEKKETVSKLVAAYKKADEIYLATDPDREGEAISWHVANILELDSKRPIRIVFNEISKKAVQNALKSPRPIDAALVDAQQARRILDRLVGYKISPVLSRKIQSKLSAGRVQSVTLRLVVEREREILSFVPEEYWPFHVVLENGERVKVKAALNTKSGKKIKLKEKQDVDEVIKNLGGCKYSVDKIKKSIVKIKPPAPFITSTLQQDALNKLGMSLKRTTSIAQELYEGVELPGEGKTALVTYIRTDSTRISQDAQEEAKSYILKKYGNNYVPAKPNVFASKKNVQDAHEAIRPITLDRTPKDLEGVLSKDHYRLYKLIFERFLASQMSECEMNSMTVDINGADYGFRVTGRSPLFAGYTVIYKNFEEEKEDGDDDTIKLPALNEGEILNFVEFKYEQKFTKPPSRYTDASLIKTMEEKGVGRPATYSPTVTLLSQRSYTEKEGKFIKPTKLGFDIIDMLVRYFPKLFDITFTAEMESKLDEIEEGGKEWQKVIELYYGDMEDKITFALGDSFSLKKPPQKSDVVCELCGATMLIKQGRFGDFLACPSYPKCKNTKPLETIAQETESNTAKAGESLPPKNNEASELCEKCGKPMVQKMGKFGIFFACSGYPKCKNIKKTEQKKSVHEDESVQKEKSVQAEDTATQEVCEKCGKPMVTRVGRFGKFLACSGYPKCKNIKNNEKIKDEEFPNQFCPKCAKPLKMIRGKNVFYGCTGYPECSFTTSFPLAEGKCPKCGSHLNLVNKKEQISIKCANKDCDYVQEKGNE